MSTLTPEEWQALRDTFAGSTDPAIRERGDALVTFAQRTVEQLDEVMGIQQKTRALAETLYLELLLRK